MSAPSLKILQVSSADSAGGAERSAYNLFEKFEAQGHQSWLVVGHRKHARAGVSALPNASLRNPVVKFCDTMIENIDRASFKARGLGRALRVLRELGEPGRWLRHQRGIEDFDFPATAGLLQLPPWMPDIVHCHNLHGGYFDLRQLPHISQRVPTILNVRDMWLASGHCAYGLGCERWKSGCGQCPDLTIYPSIAADMTAHNWQRKSAVYRQCRLYVCAPSQWLLDQMRQSILAPAIVEARVIPNGVDTQVFKPAEQLQVRRALGIEANARVDDKSAKF